MAERMDELEKKMGSVMVIWNLVAEKVGKGTGWRWLINGRLGWWLPVQRLAA
jgi:hypothetical protein